MGDIEGNEDKFNIVYFDAKPGDVIIHHPRTVHGSRGNTGASGRRRLAASIRYIGDDIRWQRKETEMGTNLPDIWKLQRDLGVATMTKQALTAIGRYALR